MYQRYKNECGEVVLEEETVDGGRDSLLYLPLIASQENTGEERLTVFARYSGTSISTCQRRAKGNEVDRVGASPVTLAEKGA
jgi:hypothetical protein